MKIAKVFEQISFQQYFYVANQSRVQPKYHYFTYFLILFVAIPNSYSHWIILRMNAIWKNVYMQILIKYSFTAQTTRFSNIVSISSSLTKPASKGSFYKLHPDCFPWKLLTSLLRSCFLFDENREEFWKSSKSRRRQDREIKVVRGGSPCFHFIEVHARAFYFDGFKTTLSLWKSARARAFEFKLLSSSPSSHAWWWKGRGTLIKPRGIERARARGVGGVRAFTVCVALRRRHLKRTGRFDSSFRITVRKIIDIEHPYMVRYFETKIVWLSHPYDKSLVEGLIENLLFRQFCSKIGFSTNFNDWFSDFSLKIIDWFLRQRCQRYALDLTNTSISILIFLFKSSFLTSNECQLACSITKVEKNMERIA